MKKDLAIGEPGEDRKDACGPGRRRGETRRFETEGEKHEPQPDCGDLHQPSSPYRL